MQKHVFISHSSKDLERTQAICQLLEQRAIKCWIAPRDVRPGYDYDEEIIDAIDAAGAMLLILSAQANKSTHVKREVERAVNRRTPVIPVRIEDIEPSKGLSYYISIKHRVTISPSPQPSEIDALVTAVRGLPGGTEQPPSTTSSCEIVAMPGTSVHPTTTPVATAHSRRLLLGSVLAVGAIAFAGLYVWTQTATHPIPPRSSSTPASPIHASNTIAVMEFKNQRTDDPKNDWYCKALQTAFNTELSKIPQLSVVAPEIIQRNAKEADVDSVTAARQLGVSRFITGSFAVLGNTIRIDARIVETINGIQELAENVEGTQDEFFGLQKQLALATLDHFKVRLTAAQEDSLKQPSNATLDKYRKLLAVEGVTGNTAALTHPTEPQVPGVSEAPFVRELALALAARAEAQENVTAEAAARALLEVYRQAHERGDVDRLATLYVDVSGEPATSPERVPEGCNAPAGRAYRGEDSAA